MESDRFQHESSARGTRDETGYHLSAGHVATGISHGCNGNPGLLGSVPAGSLRVNEGLCRPCGTADGKGDAMFMLLALGGIMIAVWGTVLWLSIFDEKQVGLIGRSITRDNKPVEETGC